jgi:hypothetical protein
MVRHGNAIESAIESALQPGRFIAWNQEGAFVADLEEVERDVAALIDSDPARAAHLYEAFIAACYLKANEIHSEWEFGNFIGELASRWIWARQAGGVDHVETARTLLSWIDRDDYGFFNDLGSDAVKVLDADGLTAFEKEVHDRFEMARRDQNGQSGSYSSDHWAQTLKSIYVQQGSVEKYLAVAERAGLTPGDCAAVAIMLEAKRKLDDALIWIERGVAMEGSQRFTAYADNNLTGMHRALLKKLGRGQEALESAWAEFEKHPGMFAYEELMRYVAKPDRISWHERAMTAAERGDLASLIELWLKVKETGRLAERLERASDHELEGLSHYVTEPAATALAKAHPAVAAKVFRALCMRTLKAAKSKYYDAALAHLEEARRCYLAAGLEQQWEALALKIRRDHYRKSSFMPGFNAIIAGKRARVDPSFLDRARWRWASKGKG